MRRFVGPFLKAGLLLTGILLLGLLALEGAARAFHWWPDPFLQPDERFGLAHIPNASGWWVNIEAPGEFQTPVRINSKGLRDREYPYEKPPGTFRILLLGDNFAEAFQVPLEDSFQEVVEVRLNGELPLPVEVINAGTWLYSTDLELLFYRLEGRNYRPDLVLLAFHAGTDVLESHREMEIRYMGREYKPFFVLKDGELELVNFPYPVPQEPPPQGIVGRVKGFLAAHSRLYPVAGRFIRRHLRRGGGSAAGGAAATSGAEAIPMDLYLYAVDPPPEWAEAWEVSKALIRQLRREVEADGGRLAVVLIPDRRQVEAGYLDWAMRTYPAMAAYTWDMEHPNRVLRTFLEAEGIPYLDLLEVFRQRTQEQGAELYYPRDGHWNVAGHRLAGEEIGAWLVASGLVPTKEGR